MDSILTNPIRPDGHGIGILPASPPTKFSWEIVKEICIRIQQGEFLVDICDPAKNPAMPEISVFNKWCEKKPKIASWLERSRKMAADVLAEKSVTLFFDDPPMETIETKNGSIERISMSGVQRERYKSQAMQWLAGKWGSDKYGDKLQVQNSLDLSAILHTVNSGNPSKKLKRAKRQIESSVELLPPKPEPQT